jgi:hypothetical protein
MVSRGKIASGAAHGEKYLVVHRTIGANKTGGPMKTRNSPCALENFPMKGARRHIKCTGIYKGMAAYENTYELENAAAEENQSLDEPKSWPTPGSVHRNRYRGRCGQILAWRVLKNQARKLRAHTGVKIIHCGASGQSFAFLDE